MLPDTLKENVIALAVHEFDAAALVDGKLDRGELTLEIAPERVVDVCQFLKEQHQFIRLSTVTAVDRYPAEPRFEVVYHLHSLERNQRLRLKCRLRGENSEIDSVTGVWRAANWYEREVFDLFGVRFRHHPDLRRIMLPDDWEGYPLRKDYPVTGARV
jgi:NADH-quinone oxidoreductase subunit C